MAQQFNYLDREGLELLWELICGKFATNALVGTLPEGITATDLVGYIQERTAGIATNSALEELTNRVADTEGDITSLDEALDAVIADYLKAADKEELAAAIKAIADDYLKAADAQALTALVTAEKERAEGVEAGLRTDIDAANAAIAILNGDDSVAGSVDKKILDEVAKILNDNDASDIDTLEEIAAWIKNDAAGVGALNAKVDANTTKLAGIDTTVVNAIAAAINALDTTAALTEATIRDICK